MPDKYHSSRLKFIEQVSFAASGLLLANHIKLFSQSNKSYDMSKNVTSKGFAGKDDKGPLVSWNFERRSVGDDDILIDIKFSGICHSEIHTIKGHWGKQQYPQVPGHEIAGIVSAVGKNVTKFKIGDKAGVGCMVNTV